MKRKMYIIDSLPLFEETCQNIIERIEREIRQDELFAENFAEEYTVDYVVEKGDTGFFNLVVWTAAPFAEIDVKNIVLTEILRILTK